MKNEQVNHDVAIDRVLAGLANVEAPNEIEQRILRALQQRAAKQEGPRFAALCTFAHWKPWAIAVCLVALSFAASVVVRKRHEPRREEAVLNQQKLPSVVALPQIQVAGAQPRQPAYSASTRRKNVAALELLSDEEALAISEMLAPSHPAPPLPLTHQEELLAETVHQPGPKDLSSLRAEARAKQMELSKAEFHDFFEQPTPTKVNE